MTAPSPTFPAPGSTVRDVLEIAAGRPAGSERVALVEEAARLALETGDESGEVAARLELVGSYGDALDPWRGIEPFPWCLSRRAERPDLFSDEQSAAIGRVYRWMTIVADINPQVGVAQVRVLEQGFDAYAREVGMSAHDLADERRIVALYLGQEDEAAAFYEDWLTTLRTPTAPARPTAPSTSPRRSTTRRAPSATPSPSSTAPSPAAPSPRTSRAWSSCRRSCPAAPSAPGRCS